MQDRPEEGLRQEFAAFVETAPVLPAQALDQAVRAQIGSDLDHSRWRLYGKLTLIQVTAGLATLGACPQFGLGLGPGHLPFLHELHRATSAPVFHLVCGLLFVSLGGILGGLVLARPERAQVQRNRFRYFPAYACLAYAVLVTVSPEAFVIGSLSWIPGAIIGNILSFSLTHRVRQQLT